MRPHSQHVNDPRLLVNRIDKAVFDVDAARAISRKVAHEFLEWRWRLKGILGKQLKQALCVRPQSGGFQPASVLYGMRGEDNSPTHQSSFSKRVPADNGSLCAAWMLSARPGTWLRYNVSSMADQSEALSTTASSPSRRTIRSASWRSAHWSSLCRRLFLNWESVNCVMASALLQRRHDYCAMETAGVSSDRPQPRRESNRGGRKPRKWPQ